ncbi:MAG: aldo/keto reductase [Chthoniobacteraceae bacterium]
MQTIELGRTGLSVSKLGLGGLFVASFATGADSANEAIQAALDLGINYIDTAPTYGDSEEVLGRTLAGEKRPVILSTKLGGRPVPFDPRDKKALRGFGTMSRSLLR